MGLYQIQILHINSSLALNESWDPDVKDDMEMILNKIHIGIHGLITCQGMFFWFV